MEIEERTQILPLVYGFDCWLPEAWTLCTRNALNYVKPALQYLKPIWSLFYTKWAKKCERNEYDSISFNSIRSAVGTYWTPWTGLNQIWIYFIKIFSFRTRFIWKAKKKSISFWFDAKLISSIWFRPEIFIYFVFEFRNVTKCKKLQFFKQIYFYLNNSPNFFGLSFKKRIVKIFSFKMRKSIKLLSFFVTFSCLYLFHLQKTNYCTVFELFNNGKMVFIIPFLSDSVGSLMLGMNS